MKNYIAILFLIIGHSAYTQSINDTTLPKRVIDSLIHVNELKQTKMKLEYDKYFKAHLHNVDTIYDERDSIMIDYLAKNNKIIRTERKTYVIGRTFNNDNTLKHDSVYMLYDSTITFYNKKALMEYQENWQFSTPVYVSDTNGEGMGGDTVIYIQLPNPELNDVNRTEYDNKNREVLSVYILSQVQDRVRKYYNKKGDLIKTSDEPIKEYQFWD